MVLISVILYFQLGAHEEKPAQSDLPKDHLAPLAMLVGGQWLSHGQWATGEEFNGRLVYEWGINKKILKAYSYDATPEKKYLQYESVIAWHPGKQQLISYDFGHDGSVGQAVVKHMEKDSCLFQTSPNDEPQGPTIRQTIRLLDHETFVWTMEMETEDGWQQLIESTYHREELPK